MIEASVSQSRFTTDGGESVEGWERSRPEVSKFQVTGDGKWPAQENAGRSDSGEYGPQRGKQSKLRGDKRQ